MLSQVLSYTFYDYLLSLTEMLSLWLVYFCPLAEVGRLIRSFPNYRIGSFIVYLNMKAI